MCLSLQEKMLQAGQCENNLTFKREKDIIKTNDYVVPTSKKRQKLRWEIRTNMAHDNIA